MSTSAFFRGMRFNQVADISVDIQRNSRLCSLCEKTSARVLPCGGHSLTLASGVSTAIMSVFDGRTEGRTDGQIRRIINKEWRYYVTTSLSRHHSI